MAAPSGHFVFKGLLDHQTLIFGVGFDIYPYKFGRLPAGFAVFFLLVLPTLSTKEKCNLQKKKSAFMHVVGWACVDGRVKSCISDFAACGSRAYFSFPCAKTHSI